jgi:protocatechuate 3,4-dioxygenase beta subunit
MVISGVIYKADGKTPAPDVVLYVYHTDQTGHYTKKGNETGWGKRHGYIRGWMKTNNKGEYKFYTLKPASYPNSTIPAHIHPLVKEPDKNEYWIDEYLFEGDKFLTTEERKKQENRGGKGIIGLVEKNNILYGNRDIILGLHIPDYPASETKTFQSGLSIGDNCPAFDPLHLSGVDKGKRACPMCKYGYGQGIMVWFNHANLDRMQNFVTTLEREMEHRGEKNLRVFLVYMNPYFDRNDATVLKILQGKIEEWCMEQNLKHVAMVWVPSPVDEKSCGIYKINSKAENTVFVYKKRKIAAKWVNMDYSDASLQQILKQF